METETDPLWLERHAIISALWTVLTKDGQNASRPCGVVLGVGGNGDAATAEEWPIAIVTDGGTVLMSFREVPEEGTYHFRMKDDDRVLVVPFSDIHGEPN